MMTKKDLQAYLSSIRYNKQIARSSVHDWAIHHNIVSSDAPQILQDYHIRLWLAKFVSGEYNYLRSIYNLDEVNPQSIRRDTFVQMAGEDYRQLNPQLEAWSVMYIYYTGLPFNLSTDEHEALAGMSKRTLRRRKNEGVSLLYVGILAS